MIKRFFPLTYILGMFFLPMGLYADSDQDPIYMNGPSYQNITNVGMLGDGGAWGDGQWDLKNKWSYAALGDAMDEFYNKCSRVDMNQLVKFSNWLHGLGATASLRELAKKCVGIEGFKNNEIIRGYKDESTGITYECALPDAEAATCNSSGCGERQYTNELAGKENKACDIFLSTFIQKHNHIAENISNRPGTYVEEFAPGVYKVVDVVLAPGYYIPVPGVVAGIINQAVNTSPEYTKVYKLVGGRRVKPAPNGTGVVFLGENDTDENAYVLAPGTVHEIPGLHTWTNDMFFNVDSRDSNRGVLNDSYICTQSDVTTVIYQMFNRDRGSFNYTINAGVSLLPDETSYNVAVPVVAPIAVSAMTTILAANPATMTSVAVGDAISGNVPTLGVVGSALTADYTNVGDFDTKRTLHEFCNVSGQSEVGSHTNGVMFEGKIANLEWLGHYLYGMIRSEIALVSPETADEIAAQLEGLSNGNSTGESEKHQAAASMGAQSQSVVSSEMNRIFSSTQFDTPREAVCYFMNYSKENVWPNLTVPEIRSLECFTNCNTSPATQDVVTCLYHKEEEGVSPEYWLPVRQEYVVDDVANGVFDNCESLLLDAYQCGITYSVPQNQEEAMVDEKPVLEDVTQNQDATAMTMDRTFADTIFDTVDQALCAVIDDVWNNKGWNDRASGHKENIECFYKCNNNDTHVVPCVYGGENLAEWTGGTYVYAVGNITNEVCENISKNVADCGI